MEKFAVEAISLESSKLDEQANNKNETEHHVAPFSYVSQWDHRNNIGQKIRKSNRKFLRHFFRICAVFFCNFIENSFGKFRCAFARNFFKKLDLLARQELWKRSLALSKEISQEINMRITSTMLSVYFL